MTQDRPKSETRQRFMGAAIQLFSERGFYGASMDQIAREVGLTKQALIHHFGTKEKLYGAVLEAISERLLANLPNRDRQPDESPESAFLESLQQVHRYTRDHPAETRVLMRELLDNRGRADSAGRWYLKPFLDRLHEELGETAPWQSSSDAAIAARVYQLLGAIHFFWVSTDTLKNMYSAEHVESMSDHLPGSLARLADLGPADPTRGH